MRIDVEPNIALAHAMVRRPGAYAILIGSGVSRAAKIPTGWEVTLELAGELAVAQEGVAPDDISDWYVKKFGKEPSYSDIVETLAPTRAEQRRLLSRFFEPASDGANDTIERSPTEAHRAIARLVAKGFVRVIVTTNFDRLLEDALSAEGIHPSVVKSIDDIKGMEPLGQAQCVILKVHGDYQDTRIRNSEQDLLEYEGEWDALLDRVIDEYGMIVCGWSGQSDSALCDAFRRAPNRRYSTVWSTMGDPRDEAKEIIACRSAETVVGPDANDFFSDLESKINALKAMRRPSALTVSAAEAEIKGYLSEPQRNAIRLHDAIVGQAKKVRDALPAIWNDADQATGDILRATSAKTEASLEILSTMLAHAAYHGVGGNIRPWLEAIRLASSTVRSKHWNVYQPDRYPSVLIAYSIGVPSIASGNFGLLKAMVDLQVTDEIEKPKPMIAHAHPWGWVNSDFAKQLQGDGAGRKTPNSDHLFTTMLPTFERIVPDEKYWEIIFDKWEVLFALLQMDHFIQNKSWMNPHIGRFGWRSWYNEFEENPSVSAPLANPETYAPLQAGLFGGSQERFETARDKFDELMQRASSTILY